MSPQFAIRSLALCLALSSSLSPAASIDVPFVRQQENGCGAAATAMVIKYWTQRGLAAAKESPDASAIYTSLYSREAKGIFGSRIAQYMSEHGFQPYVFEGGWQELVWHLKRGRPLIVCVRNSAGATEDHGSSVDSNVEGDAGAGVDFDSGDVLGGHEGSYTRSTDSVPAPVFSANELAPLHYLVITGIDEQQNAVVVNDSARYKLGRIGRKTFEQDWRAGKNWTLLALPKKTR